MFLFFAAFAVQWCYPGNMPSRASVGAFMLVVALMVAWCTWTARDRSDFWWFQPDPNQAENEALEGEEGDGELSLHTSCFGFFRRFTAPVIPKLMTQSLPGESHAMQHRGSLHDVLGPRSNVSQPNFWTN